MTIGLADPRAPIADNECCLCKHRWQDRPGGLAAVRDRSGVARCPNPLCRSVYWRWRNYAVVTAPRV